MFKSRLVAKGFTQIFGIDYSESFSPTPTLTILRAVIIMALQFNLELYGIDVKGAFLNAKLSEYIIIEFPDGIEVEGCKYAELLKSLYGLHQAGNDWHKMSDRIIKSFDPRIKQSLAEPCFYYIWTSELIFLMTVHVDDYTIATNSTQYYQDLVAHFKKSVEVEEKGRPTSILQMGLEWSPNFDKVSFSQKRQIIKLYSEYKDKVQEQKVKRHDTPMESELKLYPGDTNSLPLEAKDYKAIVGALLFIAKISRPDILYAVNMLSRFCSCYTVLHWKCLLRIVVYLYHKSELSLTYTTNQNSRPLMGYADSSHGDDKQDGTSTCGYLIYFFGNLLSWAVAKQDDVSLSTSEAEYKTLTHAFREVMYIHNVLHEELSFKSWFPCLLLIDNQGAGYMAETQQNNKRTKHIHISYHYIREKIQQKVVELDRIDSANNTSDVCTKPLPKGTFQKFRQLMGII